MTSSSGGGPVPYRLDEDRRQAYCDWPGKEHARIWYEDPEYNILYRCMYRVPYTDILEAAFALWQLTAMRGIQWREGVDTCAPYLDIELNRASRLERRDLWYDFSGTPDYTVRLMENPDEDSEHEDNEYKYIAIFATSYMDSRDAKVVYTCGSSSAEAALEEALNVALRQPIMVSTVRFVQPGESYWYAKMAGVIYEEVSSLPAGTTVKMPSGAMVAVQDAAFSVFRAASESFYNRVDGLQ